MSRTYPWDKASVTGIIKGHLSTFKIDGKKPDWAECLWFFGVPVVIAVVLSTLGVVLQDNASNLLATTLSIFAALLFNLIILVVDMVRKNKDRQKDATDPSEKSKLAIKGLVMEQLNNTVGFEVFLALVALVLLFVLSLPSPVHNKDLLHQGRVVVSTLTIAVVTCFTFNLFIVLKRLYRLIDDEFDAQPVDEEEADSGKVPETTEEEKSPFT